MPDKTRYSHIQATQVPALIDKHFATNQVKQRQDRASEVAMSTANIGSISVILYFLNAEVRRGFRRGSQSFLRWDTQALKKTWRMQTPSLKIGY
jgi:hypothetical protein